MSSADQPRNETYIPSFSEETYLPDEAKAEALGLLRAFVDASKRAANTEAPRLSLVDPHRGERVAIPTEVTRALLRVITAMSDGLAVTIVPHFQILPPAAGAKFLSMAKEDLLELLQDGTIPYQEDDDGSQWVHIRDLLEYDKQQHERIDQFLTETAVPIDEQDDPEEVIAWVREARKKGH